MRRFTGLSLLFVLAAGASAAAQEDFRYRAGTAKVKITPEEPGYLLAYDQHQKAEGVESELWTRALALEDADGQIVVLVSADILGFNPSLARAIRQDAQKRFGLKDGQLLLAASHTHNGPVLPENPSLEIYHNFTDEEAKVIHAYAEVLRAHVLDAVGKALGELRPARLSWGRGQATFGANRRRSLNPNGPTDPDVPILSVDSPDGRPIAVVFSYACHLTTVMASHFVKYSADYAGVAAEELERKRPGGTALFIAGCGGDINPDPMGKIEYVRLHGRTLAEEVERVLARREGLRPLRGPLSASFREIELPLDKPPPRELLERLRDHKSAEQRRHAQAMLRAIEKGDLPSAVPYPILVWRFGSDLTLVGLSGEVCVDYALRLKRELGSERTWIAGYANQVPCYIPSDRVLAEGGYEAGWGASLGRAVASGSMSRYGWPVPFAPGLEDRIVKATRELAQAR
ncbi:MAG: neutral/alkaline non-lysosomal ceramidase N-terminal domain-containing protein [Pirellulales bacterium]